MRSSGPIVLRGAGDGRRGFTLVETLLSLLLLSAAGLLLVEGGRWLLLSSQRLSSWLLARERGQRVLSFIEPRVLHSGLGLSACREEGALQRALGRGTVEAQAISSWPLFQGCIAIFEEGPLGLIPVQEREGVFRGTALSCVYARATGVILKAAQDSLSPGGRVKFEVLSETSAAQAGFTSTPQDLLGWGILPMTGMPLRVVSLARRTLTLNLSEAASDPVSLQGLHELFLPQCDRFHVSDEVFRFQGMRMGWYPANFYPREEGILALWCEWRPHNPSLDLWVLASGGPAVLGPSPRPSEWPEAAPWEPAFGKHELCVCRASWRPENL